MESDDEIRAQLRTLERAEAAPYTDFRPTPRWFLPAAALWGGSLAALVRLGRSDSRPAEIVAVVGIIGLSALLGVYVAWYQSYHGATPSLFRKKPPEIRRVMGFYAVGAAVVLALNALTVAVAPWWVCAVVGFVTTAAGLWWYERAYVAAAAATKKRLA
ncbi:hypothetical protein KV102_08790 [Mumia sp. zg.B53]|uniref:hypothetical protein n=1 Tax=unclassified Mumia TaxID=2621872 RepID=UPI001C6E398A|nr:MULTISPECIES: hypothetical protein [unclassified Mumia]MBW9207331.1 hypothetical protein [Mumia sp. zg.B17]MBW9210321.1 hypothetical protein [Mumia sp. zg.B21]MBW9214937.1 hypothetical protein [Mumia sp. zg.B53]MDD9347339.1 hypothetical protein [Mumia sp.]